MYELYHGRAKQHWYKNKSRKSIGMTFFTTFSIILRWTTELKLEPDSKTASWLPMEPEPGQKKNTRSLLKTGDVTRNRIIRDRITNNKNFAISIMAFISNNYLCFQHYCIYVLCYTCTIHIIRLFPLFGLTCFLCYHSIRYLFSLWRYSNIKYFLQMQLSSTLSVTTLSLYMFIRATR